MTPTVPSFTRVLRATGSALAFGAPVRCASAVCVETASTRDTAVWLYFLDGLERFAPSGEA